MPWPPPRLSWRGNLSSVRVFITAHYRSFSKPGICYRQVQGWASIFNAKGCTKFPSCWLEWFSIFSQSRRHKHTSMASRIMFYTLESREPLVVCHWSLQRQSLAKHSLWTQLAVRESNQRFLPPWAVALGVLEGSLPALLVCLPPPLLHCTSVLQSTTTSSARGFVPSSLLVSPASHPKVMPSKLFHWSSNVSRSLSSTD